MSLRDEILPGVLWNEWGLSVRDMQVAREMLRDRPEIRRK